MERLSSQPKGLKLPGVYRCAGLEKAQDDERERAGIDVFKECKGEVAEDSVR